MEPNDLTRRKFIGAAVLVSGISVAAPEADAQPPAHLSGSQPCSLTINGVRHELKLEPRTTLLDLLREHLQLSGTKKGCDHGQCGATWPWPIRGFPHPEQS
jgi:xanthine dehydrogenase YagT iron-sulfur-binding subunit